VGTEVLTPKVPWIWGKIDKKRQRKYYGDFHHKGTNRHTLKKILRPAIKTKGGFGEIRWSRIEEF